MFDRIETPEVDIYERMKSRFLLELQRSPVLLQLVAVFASEIQVFIDACRDVIQKRGPADATGENLNAIGRIVGQLRILEDFDAIAWFASDRDYQGADFEAPVWVTNAPVAGNVVAGDGFFRQLIEAKVLRNHTENASIPELQSFVKQAFGIDISVRLIDKMTIQLIIPDDTDFNTTQALERYETTDSADNVYLLPLAAGVKIGDVTTLYNFYRARSVYLNAMIQQTASTGLTLDAVISLATGTGDFSTNLSIDAILKKAIISTVIIDSIITILTPFAITEIDALIKSSESTSVATTIDAIIEGDYDVETIHDTEITITI